ncbi:hypothetical protein ABIE18_002225 [Arthrobacter sp. 2762]
MLGRHKWWSAPHARTRETKMSGSRSEEIRENSQELTMGALLDEEFRSVFEGSTPVAAPWAGLYFI